MHLHVGLVPQNFNHFFRALGTARDGAKIPYHVDGDGWNVWGEGVNVNGNDPFTCHVIINVRDKEEAEQVLALGPLMVHHKDGFDALLTDHDNWGIVYQSFPDNVPGLVPNSLLTALQELREYGHSFASDLSGANARNTYEAVDDAYETLLLSLQELYKEFHKCNRQHS